MIDEVQFVWPAQRSGVTERERMTQSLTALVLPARPRLVYHVHSCGTQAILNLILNIDDATASEHGIKLGEEIKNFKEFTQCLPADVSSISVALQ